VKTVEREQIIKDAEKFVGKVISNRIENEGGTIDELAFGYERDGQYRFYKIDKSGGGIEVITHQVTEFDENFNFITMSGEGTMCYMGINNEKSSSTRNDVSFSFKNLKLDYINDFADVSDEFSISFLKNLHNSKR